MKLQQTFIHEGKKRVVVGKPVFNCTRDMYFEYVDYGTPLHKQKRVRVYLSELETGRKGESTCNAGVEAGKATSDSFGFSPAIMGDASTRKDEVALASVTLASPTKSPQVTDKFIAIDEAPYLELVKG